MAPGPQHEVANLRRAPGELAFEARVGERVQPVWFRTETPLEPTANAALAACLIPAMGSGGTLTMTDPISPRILRTQREYQAIQRAWSLDWTFGDPPLHEVEVLAPAAAAERPRTGRVAAFFSGGVDSWSTVIANPDLTDLIFVRGIDILPRLPHQAGLADEVETRLRQAADELGLALHVVETNLRELSDPLVRWEVYCACAIATVALFLEPLFDRVLITTDTDHETQPAIGPSRMVDQLWSSEGLEIVDEGGCFNREQRIRAIADHPVVQRSLRVCWENLDGAYNCGRCRKCLLTMISLEAIGALGGIATFPPLDLDLLADFRIEQPISLVLWEDVLDTTRSSGRADLERPVADLVRRGRLTLGLPPIRRSRREPGPPAPIRVAVVVPAWRQAGYLASAVRSALDQEIGCGVGVVVVDDGCPDPETDRIGQALRDAHPDRVAYLRQPNRGVSAARNAGIRRALARWPQVEAIFPLDADNILSPHTLAKLLALLEERPQAAWATPALEFFGAEEGEWLVPGPYLLYRQLLANQCDAGSLIRRQVFAAGISYDETIRNGFEDWELFLKATLAGFRGVQAGRCGFRYRRRSESMVEVALARAPALEAEIRERHEGAYTGEALARYEHAEAPRFGLVRCDRGDVLLTACCDLEPRRLALADFARSIAATGGAEPVLGDHVPAVTVLTTAATVAELEAAGLLAQTLFGLQTELRGRATVGLRIGPDAAAGLAALAIRGSALPRLHGGALPEPEAVVVADGGAADRSLPEHETRAAASLLAAAAASAGLPLPATANSSFLEHLHIERRRTTFPLSGPGPHRQLDTLDRLPA